MIDTHCHLTYDGLYERLDEVLAAAAAAGVDRMITVGTTPEDIARARGVAGEHAHIWTTAGLHPHYADEWRDLAALTAALREHVADEQVIAFGEMGLDRHYPDPPIDVQKQAFAAQLALVAELSDAAPRCAQMPIIIHNREATDETLEMVLASGIAPERFVFHCFTGTRPELEKILAFGAAVGFTGIVTFNSARDLAEASDIVPIERMLVETDSPYLTPAPYRKIRTNEPRYVVEVAKFLATRRGMTVEAFTAQVDANAKRVFGV